VKQKGPFWAENVVFCAKDIALDGVFHVKQSFHRGHVSRETLLLLRVFGVRLGLKRSLSAVVACGRASSGVFGNFNDDTDAVLPFFAVTKGFGTGLANDAENALD